LKFQMVPAIKPRPEFKVTKIPMCYSILSQGTLAIYFRAVFEIYILISTSS
jgi:hypothetical protein